MIETRYAKALFQLTASDEELERRCRDLNRLVAVLNRYPFFFSPHISKENKEEALKKGLEEVEDKQLVSFLLLLVEKRRFNYLQEIVKAYSQMVREKLGQLKGRLVTAEPVEPSYIEKLKGKLEKQYGKKVFLEEETDPRLIGGGILTIGNRLADFSIKGKLEKLKRELLN